MTPSEIAKTILPLCNDKPDNPLRVLCQYVQDLEGKLEKAMECIRFYADCPLVWEQSLGGSASPIRAPLNTRAKAALKELGAPLG